MPVAERRGVGVADGMSATRACTSTSIGRAPSRIGATTDPGVPARWPERNSADGSGTSASPDVGHLEEADLLRRPEPVLERVQVAERMVAVAGERQHGVDDVLERARPGQVPVLRDVTDEERRQRTVLGEAHELLRALAHLAQRPGRAGRVGVDDGLDGVDREHVGGVGLDVREHVCERGVGREEQLGAERAEPLGPQADLLGGLLGTDEEAARAAVGQATERLQEQGALAHAGLAPDEGDRAGHEAAAEHAIELADAGGPAGRAGRVDVRDRERRW